MILDTKLQFIFQSAATATNILHFRHSAPTLHSFTKQNDYEIVVSKDFLGPDDRVVFVDDFLAYGNTGCGIVELCRQASATLLGMGFIIEKEFQHGREALHSAGVDRIESLSIIESLDDDGIHLKTSK